jgi:hypothetical protein
MSESEGNNGLVEEPTVQKQIEELVTHLHNMVEVTNHVIESNRILTQNVESLFQRLVRVENKTQGLSDRPANRNCPSCHKKVTTATGVCGACGHLMA